MANRTLHDVECSGWQVECWGEAGLIHARLLYRGEHFGPEFEATTPRAIASRVARYLLEVSMQLEERRQ